MNTFIYKIFLNLTRKKDNSDCRKKEPGEFDCNYKMNINKKTLLNTNTCINSECISINFMNS